MATKIPLDEHLEQEAWDTLALMSAGIPYDGAIAMHPRMRAAFLRALDSMHEDEPKADGDEVPMGVVN